MSFLPSEIIKKKRNGAELSDDEIASFINQYTSGEIPDYQMSALLMAVFFKGMSNSETLSLTKAMLNSGVVVRFPSKTFKVDKHSTGGVGDKTSLILGPIVAAAGVPVPMISGRGLGHTGGTLDKLESIPGFNINLNLDQFINQVENENICFIGQTKEICPADKKIYALRDVTATVESLPLICASIMSKKLAEGIDGLVLDVKFGSGAFMKTKNSAEELARALMTIAKGYGKRVTALITNMEEPMGRFAGNSLEVLECVEIMQGKSFLNRDKIDLYQDTRELSLWLSAHMIYLAGKSSSLQSAYDLACEILKSGRALKMFEKLCDLHGGDLHRLPASEKIQAVASDLEGYICEMNTEKIGIAGLMLKAGRAKTSDIIIPNTGIEFHHKIGSRISKGDTLFTLHFNSGMDTSEAANLLKDAVKISENKNDSKTEPLIFKTIFDNEV